MHSKNMDQFCTFHQAPSHMIYNCNAAKAAKSRETTSNKGRDAGKHNDRCHQGCKNKAHLATVSVTTPLSETAHVVSSTSSNSINVASTSAAAAANAQWPTNGYKSEDCLKVSNCMQTTPATPASLPPLPRNPFPAPILDSRCTLHLTGHLQLLHKFAPHPPRSISVANNNSAMSYGSGIIHGHIMIDGSLEPVQIKNVHHVPDIPHMLISPLQLEDNDLDLQWRRGYGIKFYQGTHLHLYTIQCGWHIILPIYLNLVYSVAVAQMGQSGDLYECTLCSPCSQAHTQFFGPATMHPLNENTPHQTHGVSRCFHGQYLGT